MRTSPAHTFLGSTMLSSRRYKTHGTERNIYSSISSSTILRAFRSIIFFSRGEILSK